MKRFVISYMCYFNNNMTSKIIEAPSKLEAIKQHEKLEWLFDPEMEIDMNREEDEVVNEMVDAAFNGDSLFDIIEV